MVESFDTVHHEWLLKFLRQRIGDERVLRLISRMLKAGIMEDGLVQAAEVGTPQGSILSPLLLCEFARKKENPSLERYITSPYIVLVL